MLFEHIVVGVELLVFFLQALRLGFSLLEYAIVDLELLRHLFELVLLGRPQILEILKLMGLRVDSLLQIAHVERGLRLLLVKVNLGFAEGAHVFVEVALVKPLDVLDSLVSRVQLLTQLLYFHLFGLEQLIALLPLFLQLENATPETIKVFQHDQPLDIRQGFFGILVERIMLLLLTEGRSNDVLNALRSQELLLDERQIGGVAHTLQIGWLYVHLLLPVEGGTVATVTPATPLVRFGAVTSVFWRASAEVTQTVVIAERLSCRLWHLVASIASCVDAALGLHLLGEFPSISRLERLLCQVGASDPVFVIFVPSVVISAVLFIVRAVVFHIAEVARIVDSAHSAAAVTHVIVDVRSILTSPFGTRGAAYYMDDLVEGVVATFLSDTGSACSAH